jgi:hypothetical protein
MAPIKENLRFHNGHQSIILHVKKKKLQEECRTQISICRENTEAEIVENNALANFFFTKYSSSQAQRWQQKTSENSLRASVSPTEQQPYKSRQHP